MPAIINMSLRACMIVCIPWFYSQSPQNVCTLLSDVMLLGVTMDQFERLAITRIIADMLNFKN